MSVVLRFRSEGAAYDQARAVADQLGLSIEDYLVRCIGEGHRMLRARYCPDDLAQLEIPTYVRRGEGAGAESLPDR